MPLGLWQQHPLQRSLVENEVEMNKLRKDWREYARIIWAIMAKDILEAIKNKNTVMAIISSLFVVLMYRAIPILENRNEPPNLLVYDESNSLLIPLLENSQSLDLYTGYRSEAHMKEKLAGGEVPELGLVIPEGFDQALEAGAIPVLQGYVVHWVSSTDAVELKAFVEQEIANLTGRPVSIQIEGNRIALTPQSDGLGLWMALSTVFVLIMTGLSLVPHLFLEEKQNHTIDALLVSPASAGQVVAGKALVGLFYCVLGAAVVLGLYYYIIVYWWLAVLAVSIGSLFAVSLGLWMGIKVESRAQLSFWVWPLMLPLLIPVFFTVMEELFPELLIQVMEFIPTVVLFNLLRTSLAGTIPWGTVLLQLVWVAACTAGVLLLVVRAVHLLDRQAERASGSWQMIAATVTQGITSIFHKSRVSQPGAGSSERDDFVARADTYRPRQEPAALLLRKEKSEKWRGLRIIQAIAVKDMREAVKNKLFISIFLGTAIMVSFNTFLPKLLQLRQEPTAFVYDEGRSTIVRALTGREDIRIRFTETFEEMQQAVIEAPGMLLGLVIPPDFDQNVGQDQPLSLDGYVSHWANQDQVVEWKALFEEELGKASWATVEIDLSRGVLYPTAKGGGQPYIISLLLSIVVITIGMALVPLLLVEEKEAHTFEALLISPASYRQVIAGKALAGAAYCLIAGAVVILFNMQLFVHWGAVVLTILLVALFGVAFGMLVGVLSKNPTTTSMWGGLSLLVFIVAALASSLELSDLPPLVNTIIEWFPSTAMVNMFQISMAGNLPVALLWSNAVILIFSAGFIFLLVELLIRRSYQ